MNERYLGQSVNENQQSQEEPKSIDTSQPNNVQENYEQENLETPEEKRLVDLVVQDIKNKDT